MRRCCTLFAIAFLLQIGSTIASHAVTSPWSGTWKLDRSRSTLTGQSIRIQRIPTGYHFDFGAVSFDIGDDGAFYPTIAGRSTSIRSTGPMSWVRIHRANGKDFEHSTLRITPDQRTLIINSETAGPDGSVKWSQDVEQRVGKGNGLAGTWRSKTPGINVPATIFLKVMDAGQIRIGSPDEGNYFVLTPDGPAAANQGPRATPDATLKLRRISPNEMQWTALLAGKPFQEGIDVLTKDGDLLETTWTEKFPDEKQRAVYRRE